MTTIDLSLPSKKKIKLNFGEDVIFEISPEPSIGFTNKMLAYRKKIEKAKTDDAQFNILKEVVTLILQQDDSHDVTEEFIDKLHVSQVRGVFDIYENESVQNMNSPN